MFPSHVWADFLWHENDHTRSTDGFGALDRTSPQTLLPRAWLIDGEWKHCSLKKREFEEDDKSKQLRFREKKKSQLISHRSLKSWNKTFRQVCSSLFSVVNNEECRRQHHIIEPNPSLSTWAACIVILSARAKKCEESRKRDKGWKSDTKKPNVYPVRIITLILSPPSLFSNCRLLMHFF